MTKHTRPLPSRRAYAVDKPDHLTSVRRVTAEQGTPAQRKSLRDAVARRYPGLKEKTP